MCFRKKQQNRDMIEFTGDNSVLFQVVDAGKGYHNNAVVVVPMTHVALVIQNGALREKISGGSVPLFTAPQKRGLFKKSKNVEVHSLKVIYMSKTARLTVHWGTNINQRIAYIEPTSGLNVSVGAFGAMDISIREPETFYLKIVAAEGDYSLERLQDRIRAMTVNETFRIVKKVLVAHNPAYTELDYAKDDIQDRVGDLLAEKYVGEFGFEVTNFRIENLNIDEDSLKELNNRNVEDSEFSRGEVIYAREKEAERKRKRDKIADSEMDDALYEHDLKREREQQEYDRIHRHEEEDRAWAREDKKMEAEERRAQMYFDATKELGWEGGPAKQVPGADNSSKTTGHHCTVCGAAYKPGAKYCPDCGATLPREDLKVRCGKCGAEMSWGTKYCPACGSKVEN